MKKIDWTNSKIPYLLLTAILVVAIIAGGPSAGTFSGIGKSLLWIVCIPTALVLIVWLAKKYGATATRIVRKAVFGTTTVVTETVTGKGRGVLKWLFIIAVVVTALYLFGSWVHNTRRPGSRTTTPRPEHWRLTWFAVPGVPTRNNRATGSYRASVIRNDPAVMEVVMYYNGNRQTRFFWDKTRGDSGEWSQAEPRDGGKWFLKATAPGRFTGAFTYVKSGDQWIPCELVRE